MWIADVFGRERAEQLELDDLSYLFHRTSEMDVLERPDNHLILGAKGSGKSTALRALTLRAWSQRTKISPLPFAGVYLPMSDDHVSIFRTVYDERQRSEVFEHFLAASLLHEASVQFRGFIHGDQWLSALLSRYFHRTAAFSDLSQITQALLDDRHETLRAIRAKPTCSLDSLTLKTARPLSVRTLTEFAELFADAAHEHSGALPARLGLCLDSFDYYGQLGAVVTSLMQSDSGVPLTVKLAARTLDTASVFGGVSTRKLELTRDYDLVTVDRETEGQEYFGLVRDAVSRRVRRLGPAEARNVSDEEISNLLFSDSQRDPGDLASFESFCRLSSGNILAVILLLDEAARLQRTEMTPRPDGLVPLERRHRLQAVQNESNRFWEFEIGVRVPTEKLEATVFCHVALDAAKRSFPNDRGSPLFSLPSVSPDRHLIAGMLASRVLTATDSAITRRVQAGFELSGAFTFELNRELLPAANRLPILGQAVVLDRKEFGAKFTTALKSARPHLSPHATRGQRDFFAQDFCVFVSLPYDRARKQRSRVLRTSINRIYKEKTGREGGEGRSYIDIHFIPQTGPFRLDIPRYIRDATYMVADVSDVALGPNLAPGVFYEVGIGIMEQKPLALFFNATNADSSSIPFDPDSLPLLLRGQTVLCKPTAQLSFHEAFKAVHEKLTAHLGFYEHPLDMDGTKPSARSSGRHAYVSFQPRHANAEEWFSNIIRSMFPEVRIERAHSWAADEAPIVCDLISHAEFSIIDCTGGINSQALELGLAAAGNWRRTIEVWNTSNERRLNPVSMFPGPRLGWNDLGDADEEEAKALLLDLTRATSLGARRG
jgi:hypothetical protein